jgi:hypothetical protein
MLCYTSECLLWALYFVHSKGPLRRQKRWRIGNPYGQTQLRRISTTSFLTATTLIYAIGAGITVWLNTYFAHFVWIEIQIQDETRFKFPVSMIPLWARETGWSLYLKAWFPMGRTISYAALCQRRPLPLSLWTASIGANALRTWLRITHCTSLSLLPYPRSLPWPHQSFNWCLVDRALGTSRQFDSVATFTPRQNAVNFTSTGFTGTFAADSRSFRGCWPFLPA